MTALGMTVLGMTALALTAKDGEFLFDNVEAFAHMFAWQKDAKNSLFVNVGNALFVNDDFDGNNTVEKITGNTDRADNRPLLKIGTSCSDTKCVVTKAKTKIVEDKTWESQDDLHLIAFDVNPNIIASAKKAHKRIPKRRIKVIGC